MSASLSIAPSTAVLGQPINGQLTITNSDTINAVSLLTVNVLAYGTSATPATPGSTACAISQVPLGPNAITLINASSSLIVPITVTFFDPSNGTYSIGANIASSDGSSFAPTPQTVTINQLNSHG